MPTTIQQSLRFEAPPERVYALYANARLHAESTGAASAFEPRAGAAFQAHAGWIRGRLLALEPSRLIVQTWRSREWKRSEADSVLMLSFAREGQGTRMQMVHANVPDDRAKSIRAGWRSHYWNRWRRYLRTQP